MEKWAQMLDATSLNFEMRWKSPGTADSDEGDAGRWVLATCMPSTDEDGNVATVFGCITDIDAQKRAETFSLRRAEALERARASEQRFVRFTESAAVPIYILEHPSKLITYCEFPSQVNSSSLHILTYIQATTLGLNLPAYENKSIVKSIGRMWYMKRICLLSPIS